MGKKVVRKRLKELGLSAKVLACAHLRRRVLTLIYTLVGGRARAPRLTSRSYLRAYSLMTPHDNHM